MSSHDEYSSDEEDFVSGGHVTLGYVDIPLGEISADDDPITIEDTILGGEPMWLHPESKPDEKSLTCDNCQKKMALLLQAFAPLDGKDYDRIIYIFGCQNSAQCSKKKGSVKAIRGVSKDPERVQQIKSDLNNQLERQMNDKLKLESKPFGNPFGGANTSNPFGSSSNPFAKQEPKKEQEVKEREDYTSPPAPVSTPDASFPSYPGFLLYTDKEKFKRIQDEPELEKYRHLIEEMDEPEKEKSSNRRDSTSSNNPVLDPQTSKISNMLDDKYFENFSTTVNHNPGQVLRYDLGGNPLLYSGKDDIAKKFISRDGTTQVPNPGYNPSSSRQFELQLMPKAIMDLENVSEKNIADILNGMCWGTVIVCTDKEDFMPSFDSNHVGYVQEWCGVQWEEST